MATDELGCKSTWAWQPPIFFSLQIKELFISFEDAPLGAASLAQVHKAVLQDGRTVAVKVQHPKVQTQSSKDMLLMEVKLCTFWLSLQSSFLANEMDFYLKCSQPWKSRLVSSVEIWMQCCLQDSEQYKVQSPETIYLSSLWFLQEVWSLSISFLPSSHYLFLLLYWSLVQTRSSCICQSTVTVYPQPNHQNYLLSYLVQFCVETHWTAAIASNLVPDSCQHCITTNLMIQVSFGISPFDCWVSDPRSGCEADLPRLWVHVVSGRS